MDSEDRSITLLGAAASALYPVDPGLTVWAEELEESGASTEELIELLERATLMLRGL